MGNALTVGNVHAADASARSGVAREMLVTRSRAIKHAAMRKKPSIMALRRPNRTPTHPAGSAPMTPPMAQAMNPIVTSSGRTPKRSVPCSANHVVNVWKTSCRNSVATKMARMPGTTPRTASRSASSSERTVASAAGVPCGGGSTSPTRSPAAIASTVAAAMRNATRIPSIRPSMRKTIAPTHIWKVTEPVARERKRDGTASATSAWNGDRWTLIPVYSRTIAAMMPAMPKRADHGKSAIPSAESTRPPMMIGSRPRPAALARSDAVPLQGTRRSINTLSIAITMPMAVRCSPSVSRTIGGMKVLSSGPVTPAKSPPSPTHRQTPYGTRAECAEGSAGAAGATVVTRMSSGTAQYYGPTQLRADQSRSVWTRCSCRASNMVRPRIHATRR